MYLLLYPMAHIHAPGVANSDHRDRVGRIYKGNYQTLLYINYKSSELCRFRKEEFVCVSYCKSVGANDTQCVAIFDPRGILVSVNEGYH